MRLILPALTLFATPAIADVRVVTDIAPIHSLVTQVMGDAGTAEVLVSGAASPHDFQFTFDQADAVQNADLVIWVGEGLTPWLEEALDTLAPNTPTIELLETSDWPALELRNDDAFEAHDHGHDDHHESHEEGHNEDHHEDHDAHEHDDHGHDETAHDDHGHDDHGQSEDAHNDHDDHDDHGRVDPHAWLDPQVAIAWVAQIEAALSTADPDNATQYSARATQTVARLAALELQISETLADIPASAYVVPHDAYQYFEQRFDRPASGTISLSDANAPSASRIAELKTFVRDEGVTCVLTDPQSRTAWVELVREGTQTHSALADPIGTTFDIGPNHYDQTLLAVAQAYADCLSPS